MDPKSTKFLEADVYCGLEQISISFSKRMFGACQTQQHDINNLSTNNLRRCTQHDVWSMNRESSKS